MIQHQPLMLLVDTGASVTVINTSVYRDLSHEDKPTLTKPPATMTNADGTPIPCSGTGVFELCVEGVEVKHDV